LESICSRLLAHCLEGSNWSAGLIEEIRGGLASDDGSRVFFREVIEPLGDRFEPFLCDAYARLLADILGQPELLGRYRRIREPRAVEQRDPRAVYVLSRITLGADVAVTSVLLDAAKTAFPHARIVLVGPRKNWELFADDSRIEHRDFAYARSAGFASRMAAKPWIEDAEGIVLDPDSRLSQLGLLPVTPGDGNYYFFESRSYKAESTASLPELASQWCLETLGHPGRAFVNPKAVDERIPRARVTVNLGVGENPSKRLADPFEQQLLAALPDDTLIDLGGSELEARRVRNAAGAAKRMFQGSFADFSWLISQSRLYVGYDSAGMHVAAAGATPLVCVFAGAVSERFFWRWRPTGQGPIDIIRPGPGALEEALQAIGQRLASG
jgi:hypothetical protein